MKLLIKLLFVCSLLGLITIEAEARGYVYIQGSESMPMYVKVEGKMIPRYAKQYAIISNLDEGNVNIEILFQGNMYPAQKFNIYVPESGQRGFILTKQSDNLFALYDMQRKNYITAGDAPEEPFSNLASAPKDDYLDFSTVNSTTKESSQNSEELPDEKPVTEDIAPEISKEEVLITNDVNEVDRFLENLDLNKSKKVKVRKKKKTAGSLKGMVGEIEETLNQTNSSEGNEGTTDQADLVNAIKNANQESATKTANCPYGAMTIESFERFAAKLLNNTSEERKLRLIRKQAKFNCFTIQQVKVLGKLIKSSSARFEALKMLKSRTVDVELYGTLESLFKSKFLKKRFLSMAAE